MITNISLASVFVKDVDASKKFYVEVLGFDEGEDITLGDYRWCTVRHPNQPELQVHLAQPGPPHSPEMVESIKRALDEHVHAGGNGAEHVRLVQVVRRRDDGVRHCVRACRDGGFRGGRGRA